MKIRKVNSSKPCCLNCAFLCKMRYSQYLELDHETRQKIKDGDEHAVNPIKGFSASDVCRLACHKSQLPTSSKHYPWVQGALIDKQDALKNKKCEFFCPYDGHEGVDFDAIADKQKHDIETKNALIARKSFWISVVATIIALLSLYVAIIKDVKQSPQQCNNTDAQTKHVEDIKDMLGKDRGLN